jgi:hypothetical protein
MSGRNDVTGPIEYGAYVVPPGGDEFEKRAQSDNPEWMQAIVDHNHGAGLRAEVREIGEGQDGAR